MSVLALLAEFAVMSFMNAMRSATMSLLKSSAPNPWAIAFRYFNISLSLSYSSLDITPRNLAWSRTKPGEVMLVFETPCVASSSLIVASEADHASKKAASGEPSSRDFSASAIRWRIFLPLNARAPSGESSFSGSATKRSSKLHPGLESISCANSLILGLAASDGRDFTSITRTSSPFRTSKSALKPGKKSRGASKRIS